MANWLTYRIEVGDDVLVLADEEAQELIKNETERSKKADAQIASFLESTTTNGIIRNSKSDPFGQTAIGGMKVVIDEGDLIINGNIKNHARLTRTYNVMQENRTEVFLYRFDSVTNEITRLWRDCIIQGDIILSREDKTELPLRRSGYYDILICKITIPAGATEITQDMIGDFRQNEYYCGYAKNLLVDIDETLTKSDAAADAAAVGTVISNLRKETRTRDIITEKRITNLEAGLPAERWSVDDSVTYIKEVPENALPFAGVDMIGGMTRKTVNLIPIPYDFGESTTFHGVTFTANTDGSIRLSGTGTNTQLANLYLNGNNKITLPAGTYTISGIPISGNTVGFVGSLYDLDGNFIDYVFTNTFSITESRKFAILLQLAVGASFPGETIYPMLNEGETALPYEPYFDGLRSAPVTEVESVGVNLFDIDAEHQNSSGGCYKYIYKLKPNTNYTLSSNVPQSNPASLYFNGVDSEYSGVYDGRPLTAATDANGSMYIDLRYAKVSNGDGGIELFAAVKNGTYYIQLEEGEKATEHTPYRRNTIPIPAAVQALDGYGWGVNDKIYNYIDWERKQFVKRVGCVDMGTLEWDYGAGYFRSSIPIGAFFTYATPNLICAIYKTVISGDATSWVTYPDMAIGFRTDMLLCVTDSTYTDAATFKAAMSGVMLYYELAEPVITDISDMLPDDNLIGVEGGGTVTMVNEYGYDVPSEITYQLKGAEA